MTGQGISQIVVYSVALVGGLTVAFDNPARRAFVVEMFGTMSVTFV